MFLIQISSNPSCCVLAWSKTIFSSLDHCYKIAIGICKSASTKLQAFILGFCASQPISQPSVRPPFHEVIILAYFFPSSIQLRKSYKKLHWNHNVCCLRKTEINISWKTNFWVYSKLNVRSCYLHFSLILFTGRFFRPILSNVCL